MMKRKTSRCSTGYAALLLSIGSPLRRFAAVLDPAGYANQVHAIVDERRATH